MEEHTILNKNKFIKFCSMTDKIFHMVHAFNKTIKKIEKFLKTF